MTQTFNTKETVFSDVIMLFEIFEIKYILHISVKMDFMFISHVLVTLLCLLYWCAVN